MSNYAQVRDGKVIQVVVINDSWTETEAQDFLDKVSSQDTWIKTSGDGSIRSKYAGIGDEYHSDLDAFVAKPLESWVLDRERKIYIPPWPKPIAVPVGYIYHWSKQAKDWVLRKLRRRR